MNEPSESGKGRAGWTALLLVCCAVVLAAAGLQRGSPVVFEPYFGAMHATLVLGLCAVVGVVGLRALQAGAWFTVASPLRPRTAPVRWLGVSAGLALLMAGLDLVVRFPADVNVPLPEALAFYPVMGFVAEVAFHVLPVVVVVTAATRLFDALDRDAVRTAAIVVAALPEAAFQVAASWSDLPPWALACLGLHLTAFGLVGLHVFRRFGFLWMFGFRMVYYLVWHVLWGWLRLSLLF